MGQFTNKLIIQEGPAHFPNPIQQFFHPILWFQGSTLAKATSRN